MQYYGINSLFFNEVVVHKIYEDGGGYNIKLFLRPILCSFIISHTIYCLVKYIFLSERNLLIIKSQKTFIKAHEKVDSVEKRLVIKYVAYFILGILIILFFWLYISTFGAVYKNSQIILFENTLISISISFVYPFFISLITGIIRINSLKSKNKKYAYKVSNFMQYI